MSLAFSLFKLLAVLLQLNSVLGDVKFPKDQSMKHRWPPIIMKHENGRIPDGHLRPFGYQKKSEGKAKEFEKSLSAEEFHETCIKAQIPCLFQDVMNKSVAMTTWDDKMMESGDLGKKNVSVEKFLADKSKQKAKVTMRHFIRNYHHKEIFIRSTVLKELEKDVPILPMVSCGPMRDTLVEVVLWASSGFTPSRLHYDSEAQLHCLMDGRKDFVLYDPQYRDVFKLQETFKGSGAGFCPWNPEILSVYENPKLGKTPWKWATLWAGDCLYIPQGYLHQVRAHSRSWSIAYHWIHSDGSDFSDCKDAASSDDIESAQKLSDTDVFWTYVDGDKRIREDMISPANLKKYLKLVASETGQLAFLQFYHFVIEANENYKDLDEEGDIEDPSEVISPEEMFEKLMTPKQRTQVNENPAHSDVTKAVIKLGDLDLVNDEVWEELATMVTPPHSHNERIKDEL
ncbi:uncharacterized protein LOC142351215 [Convolutriloba macropyga]|uniref:uncharacterized protein LOC142351215 n=1 Tax=Convolutriloba macropyga TaxID=536237 RepID=UPI003F51B204